MYRYLCTNVLYVQPQLVQLTLTGVYRREGLKSKNVSIRSFQRSLIIVPIGAGFCIANEQLFVTLATPDQVKVMIREFLFLLFLL